MQYFPLRKPPDQQSNWAQIWINRIIEHRYWSLVDATPTGYYVYLYLDDE